MRVSLVVLTPFESRVGSRFFFSPCHVQNVTSTAARELRKSTAPQCSIRMCVDPDGSVRAAIYFWCRWYKVPRNSLLVGHTKVHSFQQKLLGSRINCLCQLLLLVSFKGTCWGVSKSWAKRFMPVTLVGVFLSMSRDGIPMEKRERESYAKRLCVDLKRGVMGGAPWWKIPMELLQSCWLAPTAGFSLGH
jgi:hypothetical protein